MLTAFPRADFEKIDLRKSKKEERLVTNENKVQNAVRVR